MEGGTSKCIGILEMEHQGEWRPVDGGFHWNLKSSSVVCRQLNCGSAVSREMTSASTHEPVWWISASCVGSESSLRECGTKQSGNSTARLEIICSGKTLTSTMTHLHYLIYLSVQYIIMKQVIHRSIYCITKFSQSPLFCSRSAV